MGIIKDKNEIIENKVKIGPLDVKTHGEFKLYEEIEKLNTKLNEVIKELNYVRTKQN